MSTPTIAKISQKDRDEMVRRVESLDFWRGWRGRRRIRPREVVRLQENEAARVVHEVLGVLDSEPEFPYTDVAASGFMASFEAGRPVVGVDHEGHPVMFDLFAASAPHMLVVGPTGVGATTFLRGQLVHFLNRGARVLVLDRRESYRSRRWAVEHPDVTYVADVGSMHAELVWLSDELTDRMASPDPWADRRPVVVVVPDLGPTKAMLERYWSEIRQKGDPRRSPAVEALWEVLYAGRDLGVHLVAGTQLPTNDVLDRRVRENFGVKVVSDRASSQTWRMLAPDVDPPVRGTVRGRWHLVVDGERTKFQGLNWTPDDARTAAAPAESMASETGEDR